MLIFDLISTPPHLPSRKSDNSSQLLLAAPLPANYFISALQAKATGEKKR
jgi:hypothetical protein